MKNLTIIITLLLTTVMIAQTEEKLPYYEIPDYEENYTAGTVAARQVDALGFRFYWASNGLTEKDLEFLPSENARTAIETIDHICNLSNVIVSSTLNKPVERKDLTGMTFQEKRKQTLLNLKQAADILKSSDDVSQFKIIFGENEIPFWNNINGPIADAIWHCGQIASFRRMTGNPISSKVDHFMGKVKE